MLDKILRFFEPSFRIISRFLGLDRSSFAYLEENGKLEPKILLFFSSNFDPRKGLSVDYASHRNCCEI